MMAMPDGDMSLSKPVRAPTPPKDLCKPEWECTKKDTCVVETEHGTDLHECL